MCPAVTLARNSPPAPSKTSFRNSYILRNVLRFHQELRLRVIVVRFVRDMRGEMQTAKDSNPISGEAFENLARLQCQHCRATLSVVDRDHRRYHAIIENLLHPQTVMNFLLVSTNMYYITKAAAIDMQLTRALHYEHGTALYFRRHLPMLIASHPMCPCAVQDLLARAGLQLWTCVQPSQQEDLSLQVGDYQ